MTKQYESLTKITLDGKKVVRLRAHRKLSISEAAQRCGVSVPTYRKAETGLELQAANAGQIAEFYGVPLEKLEARSA